MGARVQKEDRYDSLLYTYLIIPIEIGCTCLGHFMQIDIMPETLAQVAVACCALNRIIRSLFEQAACGAIFCSYRILFLDLPLSGI